jgi:hypothetical protein
METVDEAGRVMVGEADDWPDRQRKVGASLNLRHRQTAGTPHAEATAIFRQLQKSRLSTKGN